MSIAKKRGCDIKDVEEDDNGAQGNGDGDIGNIDNGHGSHPRPDRMSISSILNEENRTAPSTSTLSPTPTASAESKAENRAARDPRNKYHDEEALFIWYHRIDLHESWDTVEEEFRNQFNQHRKKAGLQCKFYRLLGQRGIDKVRVQAKYRLRHENPEGYGGFGLIQRTDERPPWIRVHHLPHSMKDQHKCSSLRCDVCLNNARF